MNPNVSVATGAALSSPPLFLADHLEGIVRGGTGGDIPSYLDSISADTTTNGTKTLIRWHRLTHDATLNKPNIEKLIGKLFALMMEFACSRSEIKEALHTLKNDGSPEAFGRLQEKARRLFTSAKNTGEVGEILLYFLAERMLRYPQVLCKMPHKTSANVHAHGADGVHASVNPNNGHLRLHWGEAKLYASLDKAVEDCCSSLAEMLLSPPAAKKDKTRDIELLRDFIALDNVDLEKAIQSYLDPDDRLSNKVEFCGIALIGFNLADYSALCTEFAGRKTAELGARVANWSEKIRVGVEKHKLVTVTVDAFCIPFHSVEDVRAEFLKVLKGQNASK